MQRKYKKRKKKKGGVLRKFISIVLLILFSFFVVTGIGFAVMINTHKENRVYDPNNSISEDRMKLSIFGSAKRKTNVAVFGVDQEGLRTDVIFVISFDSKTKKINMISVPRDTRIKIRDELVQEMKAANRYVPSQAMCKMNELHAYAPKGKRNDFSTRQLESMMGIKIDYFVKMNFEGFRNIVDAIGGVPVYVPRDMNYEDPVQDLYIHLKKGQQTLDGDKAEQFVRFRKYPQGDIARVQMQQEFMKAFMKQALNEKNIMNAPAIIDNIFKYVETDFGLGDMLKYIKYAKSFQMENIRTETLPGTDDYINHISYYIYDAEKTAALVEEMFYNFDGIPKQKNVADSKGANIEVLNGSGTAGLAKQTSEMLKEKGYTVAFIGNFTGEQQNATQIIVQKQGMGEDLKAFFKESMIEVNSNKLEQGMDIQIILGLNEE